MPQASVQGLVLPVEPGEFPQLVESTFSRIGCRDFKYNKSFRQITGSDTDRYPGRHNWTIEFDILVRYNKNEGGIGTTFDISVTDNRNQWSQVFCDKRLALIVGNLIEDAQIEREESKPSDAYGSARWATEEDLRKAAYITDKPESTQMLVGPWQRREVLAINKEQTNWHALICGPTGAGKSSGFFIPNLLSRTGSSAIVTEATAGSEAPELYLKTAGYRASKGHKIYFFNPSDMTSTRINPLDSIANAPMHMQTTMAESLSDLLITNTTPSGSHRSDPVWDKAEKQLLTIFIAHVVSKDPGIAHFGGIRKLLAKPEKVLEKELADSPSGFASQEFEAFCGHSSENYRHGVFAGLMTRLNPWTSEQIVRLTSKTDIDSEQLKKELFTFYFSVPSRKAGMKPIAALTFNYLLDLALDTQFEKPMTLVLDEFTNFGYIPGIDDALSIIRRREISCMLGIQDYRQLESVYTRDKAGIIMTQVGTRVFFRPRDFKTAKDVSEGLGHQTILEQKFNERGVMVEREMGRPLMTASELMEIPTDKVLVLTPSTPPILCERFTYKTFPVPKSEPPKREEHAILKGYGEFEKRTKKEASPTEVPEESPGETPENISEPPAKPVKKPRKRKDEEVVDKVIEKTKPTADPDLEEEIYLP